MMAFAARLKEWSLQHLTFYHAHLLYFACMGLLGGLVIYLIEQQSFPFVDVLLSSVSSLCLGSLSSINPFALSVASQAILFLLMIAGCVPLLSVVPVMLRRSLLRRQVASILTDKAAAATALAERTEDAVLTVLIHSILALILLVNISCIIITGVYLQYSYSDMFAGLGIQPWWFAIFATVSAYANVGVALTPNGFVPFAGDFLVLLVQSFLILAGNVMFPILLRGFVHIVARIHPQARMREATVTLLLHPRKYYTYMFESRATWILSGTVMALTLSQWFLFLIVEFRAGYLASFSGPVRALIGWFQAVSTRTAGLQVVDIGAMHPVLQLYYAINMYISAYPMMNALRSTAQAGSAQYAQGAEALQDMKASQSNLPAADTEGVTRVAIAATTPAAPPAPDDEAPVSKHIHATPESTAIDSSPASTGAAVLQEQMIATLKLPNDVRVYTYDTLTNDVVWLTCAWIVIVWAEGAQMQVDPYPRYNNVFSALFEMLSAYGTCGLSFGYPTSSVSLCGQWSTLSKLVIMGVMFCGRQRGLPYRLDAAVYTPALLGFTPEQEDSYMRGVRGVDTLLDAAVVGASALAEGSMRILSDIRQHAPPLSSIFRTPERQRTTSLASPKRSGGRRRSAGMSTPAGAAAARTPLSTHTPLSPIVPVPDMTPGSSVKTFTDVVPSPTVVRRLSAFHPDAATGASSGTGIVSVTSGELPA